MDDVEYDGKNFGERTLFFGKGLIKNLKRET